MNMNYLRLLRKETAVIMETLLGDHLLATKYPFLVNKGRIRSLKHPSQEVDERDHYGRIR